MILAVNAAAWVTEGFHLGYPGLFGTAIIVMAALQLSSVFVRLKLNLPIWISGLGMLMIFEAIGAVYSTYRTSKGLNQITLGPDNCRGITQGLWPLILILAGTVIVYFVMTRSKIGINYSAVIGNETVAKYMGINVKKTICISAAAGAFFIGIGSAYLLSYSGRMNTTTGLGSFAMITKGLAAYLLSGAFRNFVNQPVAVLIGSFFLSMLFNVLTRMGVPSGTWQEFINGMFILVFGILSFRGMKEVVK
jgi:ribose transport system permease protein